MTSQAPLGLGYARDERGNPAVDGSVYHGRTEGLSEGSARIRTTRPLERSLTPSAGLAMGLVDLGDNGAPRAGSSSSA